MRNLFVSLSAATIATACAGGSAGPVFEYGPSEAPLRYEISGSTESVIETPMGSQNQGGTVSATVTVEIGAQAAGGRNVIVVYEALESSGAGIGRLEGGDLIGQPFVGVVDNSGKMTFTEVPPTPTRLGNYFDPGAFLSQLLMPLPPAGGGEVGSWPVHQEVTERTEMTVTSMFDGTARVVGDTVWNGITAKVIVLEGEFQMEGSGAPTGSPAELDIIASGPGTTTYIWDAATGVMLASSAEGEGTGTVDIPSMDMSLPLTMSSKQTIELQNR
ncbi:MAG: hypothetical protein JSW51_07640 [Gemmatimonadota bacterium]|nr:MAG: hypothetical protein JSW51_07640 [Gemmatimonadota bacterium]